MADAWGTGDMKAALPAQNDGWGAAPTDTNGTGSPDSDGKAGTHEMAETNGKDDASVAAKKDDPMASVRKEIEKAGWIKPGKYDYTEFDGPMENYKWSSSAPVYYWEGGEGEIGPEYHDLELELFGPEEDRKITAGHDFTAILEIEVIQEGPVKIEPIESFKTAGLHPAMLRNVELAGFDAPTPIQKFTLPAIHRNHDTIAIAQTGSGKTAAYLIPVLNQLMGKAKKLAAPRPNPATFRPDFDERVRAEPLVVVVAPCRELAIQIFNEARKFCYRSMLRPCVAYGGGPMREQIEMLGLGCDVLIATPGRLIDFMQRPQVLSLHRLRYMVIDEADEMLHDDWREDLEQIFSGGNQDEGHVRFLLFSATFPKPLRDLAKEYLSSDHVRFRVGRAGSTHANIMQTIVKAEPHNKRQALLGLLASLSAVRTIIFVNYKRMADELDDFLYNMGMPCTSMHADRTQLEREAAMRAFRSGEAPILIATGVSARGIDVRNVMHVINYDLPSADHGGIEEYIHRIGRTGRIGYRGLASSIYTDNDEPLASVLTRTLLETSQAIPDFLDMYVPEGAARENLKFEADSDYDPDEAQGTVGGGGFNDGSGDAGGDAGGDVCADAGDAGSAGGRGSSAPADDAGQAGNAQGGAWGSGGGGASSWEAGAGGNLGLAW